MYPDNYLGEQAGLSMNNYPESDLNGQIGLVDDDPFGGMPEVANPISIAPMDTNEEESYFSEEGLTSEGIEKAAARLNQTIVVPRSNQLFVDYDYHRPTHYELQELIRKYLPNLIQGITTSHSKTPGNSHVTYDLGENVTPLERIVLQLLLGSDPKREFYSYLKLRNLDGAPPTVFFENKNGNNQ